MSKKASIGGDEDDPAIIPTDQILPTSNLEHNIVSTDRKDIDADSGNNSSMDKFSWQEHTEQAVSTSENDCQLSRPYVDESFAFSQYQSDPSDVLFATVDVVTPATADGESAVESCSTVTPHVSTNTSNQFLPGAVQFGYVAREDVVFGFESIRASATFQHTTEWDESAVSSGGDNNSIGHDASITLDREEESVKHTQKPDYIDYTELVQD